MRFTLVSFSQAKRWVRKKEKTSSLGKLRQEKWLRCHLKADVFHRAPHSILLLSLYKKKHSPVFFVLSRHCCHFKHARYSCEAWHIAKWWIVCIVNRHIFKSFSVCAFHLLLFLLVVFFDCMLFIYLLKGQSQKWFTTAIGLSAMRIFRYLYEKPISVGFVETHFLQMPSFYQTKTKHYIFFARKMVKWCFSIWSWRTQRFGFEF